MTLRSIRLAFAPREGLLKFALLSACLALGPAPAREVGEPDAAFTGYLKIRQKDGTVTYEINVLRGKVVSGLEAHAGRPEVTSDIVGGWFDRERLTLMIQARDPDIRSPWAAHVHQFRRADEGFTLEHSLYGYGRTADDNIYRPHVLVEMVEAGSK